jgi:hypothetical protein
LTDGGGGGRVCGFAHSAEGEEAEEDEVDEGDDELFEEAAGDLAWDA